METESKRNFWRFAFVAAVVFVCAGMPVVLVDPFYQYHQPWFGMPVILNNAVYQTAGAARNLEYSDAIVGTSMTENFHTKWFDRELGWDTMKLCYSGARSDDLKAILTQVFSKDRAVQHIFMDINDYQLTSPSWTAYVERPEYLYSASVWDDYRYIYNRDVLADSWRRVLDDLEGAEDNVDAAYAWEDPELFGAQAALKSVADAGGQLPESEEKRRITREEEEELLKLCRENLDNILPFFREHPETEFIVYFPPYSMLYWEGVSMRGKLEAMVQVYGLAMASLLEFDNVSVYYFQNEPDIITNLDNYRDECHHRPEINRYIFECIKKGDKLVTEENLETLLRDMYEFAKNYDYSVYEQ